MNALVPLRIGTGLPGPGRPSSYDPEIAAEILERLSNGEFLIRICAEEGMPSISAVNRWEMKDAAFSKEVARARALGARCWMEQAMEIGLTPKDGRKVTYRSDNTIEMTREDAVAARKLASWVLMEGAKKMSPAQFGDKVTVQGDAANPLQVEHGVRKIERAVVRSIPVSDT
jgi:hypothetical protein